MLSRNEERADKPEDELASHRILLPYRFRNPVTRKLVLRLELCPLMQPPSHILRVCVLLLLCAPGCRRTEPTATGPDAAPAPVTRATTRTDSAQPPAVLMIDGLHTEFPHPVLRVQQRDGETFVQIYSQDLNGSVQPSTFMFDLQLDVDGADLDGAQWHFPSTNRERLDSPNGIFLAGGELVLQPFTGTILFTQHGQDVTADIDGDFLAFPSQDSTPANGSLRVTGRLEMKRKE